MARLSGLPSEHHHEGPGDAPRRKRGRPNKNQSSSQSQSQEVASTGKRTASPTAELSHTKRTKRTLANDEDQIAEEMEQSVSRSQAGDTIRVETHSSTTTRRGNRRYSEPPVTAGAQEDDDELTMNPPPSTQPASGLTPHLNRIGAVRRDLATVRRARMSMPAQLHVERVDEEVDGTQFQYAPLTAVLDSRTRRRLRRSHLSQEVNEIEGSQKKDKSELLELRRQLKAQDSKIQDLEFRLEARRLGEIDMTDEHAEVLEQELEQAREEIDALRASSLYNGSDREMSTFDGAADVSDDEDRLLLVNPDELHIKRDIDVIYTPSGKYATRLSQLTHDTLMEDDDAVVPDKIQDQAVERYERELQHYIRILAESQGALRAGSSSNDILVQLRHGFDSLRLELLHKIPELFGGIFFELKEKLTLISSSQKTEILLRRQYEGILDLLGESEERVQELEQKSFSLDKSNEEKQRSILNLEEQEAEVKDKDAQINGLNDETYRKDLDTVTHTATTFEAEHHETIARMEQEHGEQQDAREAAEGDAQQKGEIIDDLEDAITLEMTQLRERLAEQTSARETAEGERDEQADEAYQYSVKIENLDETIIDLKAQLEEALTNLATERNEANEKIEDLNGRIHDAGIQANELRSKLFQLQQEKENEIAQLEEESQAREDDLNDRLDTESQLRDTAEKTLEATLATLNIDLTNMTEARQQLEEDREDQAKYLALETSTNSTITSLQANITDLNNQVQRQQAEIERLTEEVAEKDRAEISELQDELAEERTEGKRNRKEIESLSKRVESEANELLNMMNSHSEEVDSLKTVISTHERSEEYEEELLERTREIEEMQMMGTARVETITVLQSQIEDLKIRFAKQEEDTRLVEQNEALSEALKLRNLERLKAVQEMKSANVVIKTQNVDLGKIKVAKKGSKKKISARSWRDSGMFEDGSPSKVDGEDDVAEDFLAA
ncbi:hypothetical protein EK21DRAFT_97439 [Setomelanomma holmii]|uniref:Uncharacterized protein n=1 Tax=Setomelanomma holmii TaxID=210430 RepID=A0A9P4HJF1_9PLEO|nr:hypothetical protein EK21DRAFT_97439 [Setomelanomma holmii]